MGPSGASRKGKQGQWLQLQLYMHVRVSEAVDLNDEEFNFCDLRKLRDSPSCPPGVVWGLELPSRKTYSQKQPWSDNSSINKQQAGAEQCQAQVKLC